MATQAIKAPKIGTPVTVRSTAGGTRKGLYAGAVDNGPGHGGGLWWKVKVSEKGFPIAIVKVRPGTVTVS